MTLSASFRVLALLLGGCGCLWRGLAIPPAVVTTAPVTLASTTSAPRLVPQRIETIQVGQRVAIGANPSTERDVSLGNEVIQAKWRKMTLRCPKRDGTTADVEMLRPAVWLAERDVYAGGRVEINVPECGISGNAEVLDVQPCPTITEGPGRLVTATFHHQSAATIDVRLEGEEPIGTTPNHPIWSETKRDYVRTDQLTPGEEVLTFEGTALIASITPRAGPEPVFNLEVQCEHVYRVGDAGVLVHNGGLTVLNPCFTPSNEARRNYGIAVHQGFPNHVQGQYPNARIKGNVGPGQTGPDVEFLENGPGFGAAELKPRSPSGFNSFLGQQSQWGHSL